MDYASSQRSAKKHVVGLTAVVLLHAFIVYALMTGLASKTVKVLVSGTPTRVVP